MSFEDQLRRFAVGDKGDGEFGELPCACSDDERRFEDGAKERFLTASLGASRGIPFASAVAPSSFDELAWLRP